MGGKQISLEVKQKALELFKQGISYKATARILGINVESVRRWYDCFRGGDYSWSQSLHVKSNVDTLRKAVDEYLNTENGCRIIAAKYGISASTLIRAKRNFVNFGVVALPKGRNAMKRLQEQKQALVEKLQSVSKDEYLTSKKEYKDLHDLIVVNIALLEVLEESHPDELKKKEFRQQRERLETKLASVKRALSCM